jgi:hypothetical protein
MKSSTKILFTSLGAILVIVIATIIMPGSCTGNGMRFYTTATNADGSQVTPQQQSQQLQTQRTIGNSKVITQNYSFANKPFDTIVLKGAGAMKVQVTHQPHTDNAAITANNLIISLLDIYVQNKTLYIGKKEHSDYYNAGDELKIAVNVENLKSISSHGSSDITISDIDADKFTAKISGSGDVVLRGKARQLGLEIRGSGNINTKNIAAEEVEATIRGSGDITTKTSKKIRAEIYGSGNVDYYGEPQKVEQIIRGSGNITQH